LSGAYAPGWLRRWVAAAAEAVRDVDDDLIEVTATRTSVRCRRRAAGPLWELAREASGDLPERIPEPRRVPAKRTAAVR
jgi:hypothetical protein